MNRGSAVFVAIVLAIVVLIGFAILLPCLIGSDGISPNEPSATATLRMLVAASQKYASQFHKGYADNLRKLGSSVTGQTTADHAGLVDPVLDAEISDATPVTFTKNGYVFKYAPVGKYPDITAFHIMADPVERGRSGQRSFYVDESGVIRANATAPATHEDNPI